MNDGCYDLDGNPLSMQEWFTYRQGLLEDPGRPWRVGYEEIDGLTISTIWTGVDVSVEAPPRIFETMIFDGEEPGLQLRWVTREEAEKAHATFARLLRDPAARRTYREGFTTD